MRLFVSSWEMSEDLRLVWDHRIFFRISVCRCVSVWLFLGFFFFFRAWKLSRLDETIPTLRAGHFQAKAITLRSLRVAFKRNVGEIKKWMISLFYYYSWGIWFFICEQFFCPNFGLYVTILVLYVKMLVIRSKFLFFLSKMLVFNVKILILFVNILVSHVEFWFSTSKCVEIGFFFKIC